jgi:hypothetical protein
VKKFVVIAVVLIAAGCLFYLYELGRGLHHGAAINTKNLLMVSYAELKERGAFTNPAPDRCRIYVFTNAYLITGTNYRCVLAADSWDYRSASNVLAITTSDEFLFIDKQGVVPWIRHFPPQH